MGRVKHTPGPWGVLHQKEEHRNHAGARMTICKAGADRFKAFGDWHVADVFYSYDKKKCARNIANATLIAAAPDLLKALKDALVCLERSYPDPGSYTDQTITRCRATIAQAEGK